MVKYNAFAKVNLGLSIVGKRQDGYHEIETLMVAVDLFDVVEVKETSQGLTVICPDLPDVPEDCNLAYRAAKRFIGEETYGTNGFEIRLTKSIPVGSGLGGGSSDAAAVLLAMRDLICSGGRKTIDDLTHMASEIGSDVPFFLGANSNPSLWNAALCRGRGEKVEEVKGGPFWLVTVFPQLSVGTRWAYNQWDILNPSCDCKTHVTYGEKRYKIDKVLDAFSQGNPEMLGEAVFNDFEMPVGNFYPEICVIKDALVLAGAYGACMTGSGSAVYGICDSFEHGVAVKQRFLELVPNKIGIVDVKILKTRG